MKGIGEKILRKTFSDEIETVCESNCVVQVGFMHPFYSEHRTVMLDNAILPSKQVEDWEIHHVDRKYFRGEAAIRNVERVLSIDCGLSHRYRFGYQNNHARHDDKFRS